MNSTVFSENMKKFRLAKKYTQEVCCRTPILIHFEQLRKAFRQHLPVCIFLPI